MQIEGADQLPNMIFTHQGDDGDLGRGESLSGGEDDLGSLHLNGALVVAHDTAKPISFVVIDLPNDHASG
jgi:hypothetical protein